MLCRSVSVGERTLQVIDENPNNTYNLLYGEKVILNVPETCLKAEDIPVLDMYDRVGTVITTSGGKKAEIVDIRNEYDVDIQFEESGTVQCCYTMDSIKEAIPVYPLKKAIDLTAEEDNLSREYLLDNGRTFRIRHRKNENLYRLRFTNGFKEEIFVEKNGYINLLHLASNEIRKYEIDMVMQQPNGFSARLQHVNKRGITCVVGMRDGKSKKEKMMEVLLIDFLRSEITEDYVEKEYMYRSNLRWLNTTVKTRNGDGTVIYVSPENKYSVRIGDSVYRFDERAIKFPKSIKISTGNMVFSKGGEPLTIIGGTRDAHTVKCGFSGEVIKDVLDTVFLNGSIGRQTYDLTGTSFKNRIGEKCSIIESEDVSALSIRIDTSGMIMKNIPLLSVMKGVVYTPAYTPDNEGCYESITDLDCLGIDDSLPIMNNLIFKGVCKKCGEILVRTRDGMLKHSEKCSGSGMVYKSRHIEAKVGMQRKQNCGLVATIAHVVSDDNITVRLDNGAYIFNRTFDEFRRKAIEFSDITTEMFIEKFKQDDGSVYRVISVSGSTCSIMNVDTNSIYDNISIYMLKAGHVMPKIAIGDKFKNEFGMTYIIKASDDEEYTVEFEDGSTGYAPVDDFMSELVYPDYMQKTNGVVTMYGFTDISGISFDASIKKYLMKGRCKTCGKICEGAVDVLRRHQRKHL